MDKDRSQDQPDQDEASESEVQADNEAIVVAGAREHNLQDIDVSIPHGSITVFTGISGSGKSSLAFDTIYKEGQRRYIETFSAYVRNFLGGMERPDVERITGLSPVISIEQKTISKNPRSTVGTITEVYDLLRLLYARVGDAYSYKTGEKMVRYTEEQMVDLIEEGFRGKRIALLAPLVQGRKGNYRELFNKVLRNGFVRVRIDGEIRDLAGETRLDRYKVHDIEIVVDRIIPGETDRKRLRDSCKTALKHGKGSLMVLDFETDEVQHFSRSLICPTTGISYREPEPNLFSFNSPYGACDHCNGLGTIPQVTRENLIPDPSKSIAKGGIKPLGEWKEHWIFDQVAAILEKYGHSTKSAIAELPEEVLNKVLYGTQEQIKLASSKGGGVALKFEGLVGFIMRQYEEHPTRKVRKWAQQFIGREPCPECDGTRLKKEARHFRIGEKNITELAQWSVHQLREWFRGVGADFSERKKRIAEELLKEIRERLDFLLEVGLGYLELDRPGRSLSGGEAQRIRLATQIGSKLVGVLYILDEPSIGLHQRDNHRLIRSLEKLRDTGNSVIVVEHDKDTILAADRVVDIGPGAGEKGGVVMANCSPGQLMKSSTITAEYLNGTRAIEVPRKRRSGKGQSLQIDGATGNNLQNVAVSFPLGTLICVTGVSGSGKSTLIDQTLYPALSAHFHGSEKAPLPYRSLKGIEHLDKVIDIDQAPIGKTPRSNPATYTGIFSEIRRLFSETPEARVRGYKPGQFSFNMKGGRCEHCKGAGVKTIEMNFLPDVHVRCDACMGKRYNRETLEVRYKGHSISDVLELTVRQALTFFKDIPRLYKRIKTLDEVGLGYLKLGQSSTTLSGGEAQRIKLSTELGKKETGNTFYILDEPTTGLHFEDIRLLLQVLDRLVENGNTVLVIEHNMEVIKVADQIVDLGPEGGKAGGKLLYSGKPESLIRKKDNQTGQHLKKALRNGG